jgi:hypothetical protein
MPRYLIERRFDRIGEAEMLATATRAKQIFDQAFPDVTWEHSYVCADRNGGLVSYCVYNSPDEQMLRDHADRMGQYAIHEIYEIAGDIDPAVLTA